MTKKSRPIMNSDRIFQRVGRDPNRLKNNEKISKYYKLEQQEVKKRQYPVKKYDESELDFKYLTEFLDYRNKILYTAEEISELLKSLEKLGKIEKKKGVWQAT